MPRYVLGRIGNAQSQYGITLNELSPIDRKYLLDSFNLYEDNELPGQPFKFSDTEIQWLKKLPFYETIGGNFTEISEGRKKN